MGDRKDQEREGSQKQRSVQSAGQGPERSNSAGGKPPRTGGSRAGIGSSQGQDNERRESEAPRERPSAGTADIERGGGSQQRGSEESLVQDPTGAFKERP